MRLTGLNYFSVNNCSGTKRDIQKNLTEQPNEIQCESRTNQSTGLSISPLAFSSKLLNPKQITFKGEDWDNYPSILDSNDNIQSVPNYKMNKIQTTGNISITDFDANEIEGNNVSLSGESSYVKSIKGKNVSLSGVVQADYVEGEKSVSAEIYSSAKKIVSHGDATISSMGTFPDVYVEGKITVKNRKPSANYEFDGFDKPIIGKLEAHGDAELLGGSTGDITCYGKTITLRGDGDVKGNIVFPNGGGKVILKDLTVLDQNKTYKPEIDPQKVKGAEIIKGTPDVIEKLETDGNRWRFEDGD